MIAGSTEVPVVVLDEHSGGFECFHADVRSGWLNLAVVGGRVVRAAFFSGACLRRDGAAKSLRSAGTQEIECFLNAQSIHRRGLDLQQLSPILRAPQECH